MEHKNIEDCIFCIDCGKDITDERTYKGLERFKPKVEPPPLRYCDPCVIKAKEAGFIFVSEGIFSEIMKSTPTIELMATESKMMWEQGARNQFF